MRVHTTHGGKLFGKIHKNVFKTNMAMDIEQNGNVVNKAQPMCSVANLNIYRPWNTVFERFASVYFSVFRFRFAFISKRDDNAKLFFKMNKLFSVLQMSSIDQVKGEKDLRIKMKRKCSDGKHIAEIHGMFHTGYHIEHGESIFSILFCNECN